MGIKVNINPFPKWLTLDLKGEILLLIRDFLGCFQSPFSIGSYEMELIPVIWPSLKACQKKHSIFNRHWKIKSDFPFHLTNVKYLTRVSWYLHTSNKTFVSPTSSFYLNSTTHQTLEMWSGSLCFHKSRFKGFNKLDSFKPQNGASYMQSVGNAMFCYRKPRSLRRVKGWLFMNAISQIDLLRSWGIWRTRSSCEIDSSAAWTHLK